MAKGVSANFVSYPDTIPRLLKVIKFDDELKNHKFIVLKPFAKDKTSPYTSPAFLEQVIRFCLDNKSPDAKIIIAEGSDGVPTEELFTELGYKKLIEHYNLGAIDLNNAELEEIRSPLFTKFESISYPVLLRDSFVVSLPPLAEDKEMGVISSLSNMIGAFPASKYRGFISKRKEKLRNWPFAYSIHDISLCKMPDFALIDASAKGFIIAGKPIDADKQAVRLLGKEPKNVAFLRFIEESQNTIAARAAKQEELMPVLQE